MARGKANRIGRLGTIVGNLSLGLAAFGQPWHAQVAKASAGGITADPAQCAPLAELSLKHAHVTLAEYRAAGEYEAPGPRAFPGGGKMSLPEFCRVAMTLTPSVDSDVKMEIWLPANWNGKFLMVGNGAWSGAVSYSAMAEPLRRGYAVASTDTGHQGGRGTFALGHPAKLVDFAWRAVHETVIASKAITTTYFGATPRLSYWDGCSSGGKQGLKEVQKFPDDFDGVIAGAPANNWVRLQTQSIVAGLANRGPDGKPILTPPQFAILHKAVIDACDGRDGLKDGEISDARACRFSAKKLICKTGEDPKTCLTPAMAAAADRIYAPVRDPKTKTLIYPGMPPGSEQLWVAVVMGPWMVGVDTFAVLFDKPGWDAGALDLSRDVVAAERADPGLVATNPDLSAFKARGGKLIQYHGWADALIPTENSINYYESVVARQPGLKETQDFYRLFLIPGMGHCSGAYAVDWLTGLEQWVETGHAPDRLPANKLPPFDGPPLTPPAATANLGQRMFCVYPAVSTVRPGHTGTAAEDWTCATGQRGARVGHAP